MKQTPLKRRSQLRPKRWGIKPRRPRRLDKPQSDPARLAWVREQVCTLGAQGYICGGRTEAAHEGRKPGLALKCPDAQTIPLCQTHHRQWTDHTGVFKGWTKEQRRAWAEERIAETTARYLSHGNRRAA